MKETLTLKDLHAKRLELKKELTRLKRKEKKLKIYIKKQAKTLITKLRKSIVDKKIKIEMLKSQKAMLERELKKLENPESETKINKHNKKKKSKSIGVDSEESNVYFSVPGDKEPNISS